MSQHPQQHRANILPNSSIHFSTSSSCDKPQRLQHCIPGREHILESDIASPPPSQRIFTPDTCRSLHSNYTEMPYSLGEWSTLCTAADSILDRTSIFLSNTTQIFSECSNIKKIIMSGSSYLRDLVPVGYKNSCFPSGQTDCQYCFLKWAAWGCAGQENWADPKHSFS